MKQRDSNIYVGKTKTLIRDCNVYAVQLIFYLCFSHVQKVDFLMTGLI